MKTVWLREDGEISNACRNVHSTLFDRKGGYMKLLPKLNKLNTQNHIQHFQNYLKLIPKAAAGKHYIVSF